MIINNFRMEKTDKRMRATATVTWEDCKRASYDLFFETDHTLADSLSLNPDAFLLACAVPALHYGEKRVFVDGTICAELKNNLRVAVGILKEWYEDMRKFPGFVLDSRKTGTKPEIPESRQSGFFFSGGIDSFATLYSNRLAYHPEHPMYIRDGILVYGLEQDDPERFGYLYASLKKVAEQIGITLIPVYTNLYFVYRAEDSLNQWHFWTDRFMGAALASVAHAFSKRMATAYIPSGVHVSRLFPHGSHPILDPLFSSCSLKINHDGFTRGRLDKTRLIAGHEVALKNLRVCNRVNLYQENSLNCGRCEKCVRTMIALTTVNKLIATDAFPVKVIEPEIVEKYGVPKNDLQLDYYLEMMAPLKKAGRHDLEASIQRNIKAYLRKKKKNEIKRLVFSAAKRIFSMG